jgi:hypothetical protein
VAPVARPDPLGPRQVPLPRGQRQERIIAQRVVIVEVLVTLHLRQNALREQLPHGVLDQILPAVVGEARREAPQQARPFRHLPQEQQPRVARLPAPVERRLDPPTVKPLKPQLIPTTVCAHRADPPVHDLSSNNKPLAGAVGRCVARL